MALKGALKEALVLSEELLTEIELSRSPLSVVALKASRLARLTGHFDQQQIMIYEAGGYPLGPSGYAKEVWRLIRLAQRDYQQLVDGVKKSYAKSASIEQVEAEISAAKAIGPTNTPAERVKATAAIKKNSAILANRRTYIYGFVSNVFHELKFSAVAGDVFERARVNVDARIGDAIPDAVKRFSAVYDNLVSENDEDWSNAVHSCRRILQDAADALYPARDDRLVQEGTKKRAIKLGTDNYINRLIAFAEENSTSKRFQEVVGSHLRYLGDRLDAIFKAAQKGSHDTISSQAEADRYVIYTYLLIGDILELKGDASETLADEGAIELDE